MGFAFLYRVEKHDAHYRRAVHFLQALIDSRVPELAKYAWGYPFDWVTINGTLRTGTPLITTVPYVYEAFDAVYRIDANPRWREIMRSIADHALEDYEQFPASNDAASSAYTPPPAVEEKVINASAYRACLLIQAAREFGNERYLDSARRNLDFVLNAQNSDGSWDYALDQKRGFVDHFHTCFVLKALSKIEALMASPRCTEAIARGVRYYVRELFDAAGLPKPFSRRPRLTVYRRELYDYAECLNLAILLAGRFPQLDACLAAALSDVLCRWRSPAGCFRSRELYSGWDNVPMHRWAQSQMFRSLTYLLIQRSSSPVLEA
jgi:hypothetical protein